MSAPLRAPCGCTLEAGAYEMSGWHLRRLDCAGAFDLLWTREIRTLRGRPLYGDERERLEKSCAARAEGYAGVVVAVSRCERYGRRVAPEVAGRA